jgi:glucose-1-phosphate adenylyltransferase
VDTYWRANLDLLQSQPGIDLYDRSWLIYTRSEERAPALVANDAKVTRSLISHGCVIEGTVIDSVLSPGVRVAAGAIVRDSIVMFDSQIGPEAVIDRAIIDKECMIGRGAQVGTGDDLRPNRSEPERLYAGLSLVGTQARVPARVSIGRNCRIDPSVTEVDFRRRRRIGSGETILHAL